MTVILFNAAVLATGRSQAHTDDSVAPIALQLFAVNFLCAPLFVNGELPDSSGDPTSKILKHIGVCLSNLTYTHMSLLACILFLPKSPSRFSRAGQTPVLA